MKHHSLFLLFWVVAAPVFAQTKIIEMADTTRYGIGMSQLRRTYRLPASELESAVTRQREVAEQSTQQFRFFMRKNRLNTLKIDFSLTEFVEQNGQITYALLEWYKQPLEADRNLLLRLLPVYYANHRLENTPNHRFTLNNGFRASFVTVRKARTGAGVISTLEAAERTTRPDTVKKLFFNQLRLTQIPEVVYRFPNLTELDLSDNNLTSLPERLTAQLSKLERLSLLYNAVAEDSLFFARNKVLKALNIQGNGLASLPHSVRKNRRLQSLWLGNNRLTEANFRGLRYLTDLNLYNAGLSECPPSIARLRRLKVLDLYHNRLTELSNQMGKLRHLEQLALAHNRLKQLPGRLSKLKRLQILYAHHNQIGALPDRFGRLHNLRILDLGHNFLSTTPPVLDRLVTLEELDLSHNNLQELSPGLLNLANLQKLYLRSNPIINDKSRVSSVAQMIVQFEARKTEVFH